MKAIDYFNMIIVIQTMQMFMLAMVFVNVCNGKKR